ncbi:MAG TPA: hypothetical protein VJ974_04875 [Geopsychrobacteraceae bacterium]|nr:hypothetical protein [Geopsychrobacteraceae bacterium]
MRLADVTSCAEIKLLSLSGGRSSLWRCSDLDVELPGSFLTGAAQKDPEDRQTGYFVLIPYKLEFSTLLR